MRNAILKADFTCMKYYDGKRDVPKIELESGSDLK